MKSENSQLNLSMRSDLIVELKQFFAARGKGALSLAIEREMAKFLVKNGVALPASFKHLLEK